MPKGRSEEEKYVQRMLSGMGFQNSSVDPKILEFGVSVEWMPIDHYSLTKDVLAKIEKEGKISVEPIEFIGAVSRMKKIEEVKVCLCSIDGINIGALVASEDIQREIVSIFSGDGFAPCCTFAVKSRP